MSTATLALSAVTSLLTAGLYLYIGGILRRRRVSEHARLANRMFVLWWQSLGYAGLFGVAFLGLYMAGGVEVWMYQTYLMFVLLVVFLALWGLQFYLAYLYTGSKRSFVPLGAFYGLLFFATVALTERNGVPDRIVDDGWTIRSEPVADMGLAFNLGFVLLIVGPQIVAAIAYARLYRKTTDRTQRYRIALVTGSIIVWFGSSIVATALEVSKDLGWILVSRLIGIMAALVILMAYRPPHWIRAKYGIRSIDDETEAGGVPS